MTDPTAATLERITDDLAIRDVLNDLAIKMDAGDFEAYLACWTEDAVLDTPEITPWRGREDFRSKLAQAAAAKAVGPGSNQRHVFTNQVVTLNGDAAVCESYLLLFEETHAHPAVRSMGRVRDTLRRTPDGWKLARREIARA